MDTEKKFFNYPRAAIERRKLVRQLRRLHGQSDWHVVSSLSGGGELFNDLVALDQELSLRETKPKLMADEMLQAA